MKYSILLMGVAIAALGQGAAAQVGGRASGGPQLEEVVVTAQRREERLQDVPLAITAITANALQKQGVTQIGDLPSSVPGLTITRTTNVVAPYLRGVGNAALNIGNDPSVSIYVDGVYQTNPQGLMFSFNNIERVEVLKGPQGTLFGRNATGGLIHVITRDPTATPYGKVSVGYGNFNTVTSNVYFTGGTEKVAADIALTYTKQYDGWGTNLFTPARVGPLIINGQPVTLPAVRSDVGINEEFGARTKVVVNFDDATRLKVSANYFKNNTDQGSYRNPLPGITLSANGVIPYTFTGGFWDNDSDVSWVLQTKQYGAAAEFQHEADIATVKSITSYSRSFNYLQTASDATPFPALNNFTTQKFNTFSQEVQILSPSSSSFQWLVGAYYFKSGGHYGPIKFFNGNHLEGAFDRYGDQNTKSAAIFAQTTFEILPRTNLTLGGRYTKDKLNSYYYNIGTRFSTIPTPAPVFQPGVITGLVPRQYAAFDKFTWRIALDHKLTEDVLLYASASRGYKSGVFNSVSLCGVSPEPVGLCPKPAPPVEPEVLDAYETGIKSDLLDRRLRLNLAGFYYDYSNLQASTIVGVPPVALLSNAASARIYGAELEAQFAATDALQLSASVSALNSKYKDFLNTTSAVPRTGPPYNSATIIIANAAGNKLSRAPELTVNLSATYTIPTSMGDVALSGTYFYNDGFYWEVSNRLKQKPYSLLNAQAELRLENDWAVRVWGRNLANTKYWLFQQTGTSGDQGAPAAPRTFGLTVEKVFQ